MNILVFGGSGFIGSDFISRFSQKFNTIYLASRSKALRTNYKNVRHVPLSDVNGLSGINLVLHFAFDHSYKDNLLLADSAYYVCCKNSCPLIYFSSFVVRDVMDPHLPKDSRSNLYDPYTLEKIRVKNYLEAVFSERNLPLIQIEPGIVYGKNGSWFDHVKGALNHASICLPNNGHNKAPFIYVGELTHFIYEKIFNTLPKNFSSERLLVSGALINTWRQFYLLYSGLASKHLKVRSITSRLLHRHSSYHILMYLIIFTPLGRLLFFITPMLKNIFRTKSIASDEKNSDRHNVRYVDDYRSYGITYVLQNTNYILDYDLPDICIANFNIFNLNSIMKDV